MSFKELFPEYKFFSNEKYHMNNVPGRLTSGVQGIILGIVRSSDTEISLKSIVNHIAETIPYEPTSNWGYSYLQEDLRFYLSKLTEDSKFHKFMDFMLEFAREYCDGNTIESLNELFEESNFGYRLIIPDGYLKDTCWEFYNEPDHSKPTINEAKAEVYDICLQSKEHLEQAAKNITEASNPRAYKDALRDSLSALEALINELGGDPDIEKSTNILRKQLRWGDDFILKSIISLWKHIHHEYKDIRHGNNSSKQITYEEVQFFIEYTMNIIKYISRKRQTLQQ